jgi:hypothetical protein
MSKSGEIPMYKFFNQFLVFSFIIIFSIPVYSQNASDKLIIFHIDFNSVSLKKSYLKEWLKRASDMGYNAVLWEIENEIQWETCPECVSQDAFTKDQFRDILNYSKKLGLEPIPLLQTIGHAEYVLQNEKYVAFREDPKRYDCYCTSNPEVRQFLKNWIEEYIDLFGEIRYFHLGGDEAHKFGTCPVCSKKVAQVGINQFYAEHIIDIAQPLLKKKIRPGIWGDMVLKHPESISVIPKEFIFWEWNYWDGVDTPKKVMLWKDYSRITKDNVTDEIKKQFPHILDERGNLRGFYTVKMLKNHGYEIILCSSSRSYGDAVFTGNHSLHAPNIVEAAKVAANDTLLGTCVTSWAIRIPNYETQWQWLYLGPLSYKNPHLSYETLLMKTADNLFGNNDHTFYEAINLIGFPFTFVKEKSTGIGWTGMKDSRPAPAGYIKETIGKWKSANNGNIWTNIKAEISVAPEKISKGISLLNDFIPEARSGMSILNNWSKAAYFQYWQSIIAQEIIHHEEGFPQISQVEILKILIRLKSEYTNWAETWMTPASAQQNAGLIYDAIIDYFNNSLEE